MSVEDKVPVIPHYHYCCIYNNQSQREENLPVRKSDQSKQTVYPPHAYIVFLFFLLSTNDRHVKNRNKAPNASIQVLLRYSSSSLSPPASVTPSSTTSTSGNFPPPPPAITPSTKTPISTSHAAWVTSLR